MIKSFLFSILFMGIATSTAAQERYISAEETLNQFLEPQAISHYISAEDTLAELHQSSRTQPLPTPESEPTSHVLVFPKAVYPPVSSPQRFPSSLPYGVWYRSTPQYVVEIWQWQHWQQRQRQYQSSQQQDLATIFVPDVEAYNQMKQAEITTRTQQHRSSPVQSQQELPESSQKETSSSSPHEERIATLVVPIPVEGRATLQTEMKITTDTFELETKGISQEQLETVARLLREQQALDRLTQEKHFFQGVVALGIIMSIFLLVFLYNRI